MDEYDIRFGSPEKIPEKVSEFENKMFIDEPRRGIKFCEFLLKIKKIDWLRTELLLPTKASYFWKISDAFHVANSEYHKEKWVKNLPIAINNYLGELKKNKDIYFSIGELEEIRIALENTFWLNNTTSWLKEKTNKGVMTILD